MHNFSCNGTYHLPSVNFLLEFHSAPIKFLFLDEILDRQKKLEEQVTSFLLTPGNSDDLLEDLVPKPINSEQEFDRFDLENIKINCNNE
jgi:hypothetical protein